MSDTSFDATLRKWGFRPVNEFGQPKAADSAPQKQQPKDDEETRKLAQKILTMPDVKL
jgi:hypothetical protein